MRSPPSALATMRPVWVWTLCAVALLSAAHSAVADEFGVRDNPNVLLYNTWQSQFAAPSVPASRVNHACAAVNNRDFALLMFGGLRSSVNQWENQANESLSDTWVYHTTERLWEKIADKGPLPYARYGHTLTAINSEIVLLFGGVTYNGTTNDLWMFNMTDSSWVEMTQGDPWPSPRAQHACTSALDGTMIMTGGYETDDLFVAPEDFLWLFNFTTGNWTKQAAKSGSVPLPRCAHGVAMIGSNLLIYGGLDVNSVPLNDMWQLDTVGLLWSQPEIVMSETPGPRFEHAMVGLGSRVYLFYGLSGEGSYPSQPVWVYEDNFWSPVAVDMGYTAPISRTGLIATAINDSFVVIFGGELYLSAHLGMSDNGLWMFTPDLEQEKQWMFLQPVNYPCLRFSHSGVTIRGNYLVIYGGVNLIDGFLNDVWLLDASPWETEVVWQQYPNLGSEHPNPRSDHSAVGTGHDTMIVFGGTADVALMSPPLNDCWLYDVFKGTWHRVSPRDNVTVEGRMQHTAVWRETKSQMIIFGGLRYKKFHPVPPPNSTLNAQSDAGSTSSSSSSPRLPQTHGSILSGASIYEPIGAAGTLSPSSQSKSNRRRRSPSSDTTLADPGGIIDGELVLTNVVMICNYIPANQTCAWGNISHSGQPAPMPLPRRLHSADILNMGVNHLPQDDVMVVFGGAADGGDNGTLLMDDTWLFMLATHEWQQVFSLGTDSPTARWGHSSAPLSPHLLVITGGFTDTTLLDDAWTFNIISKSWTRLSASGMENVGARGRHTSAFINKQLVLYGGTTLGRSDNAQDQIATIVPGCNEGTVSPNFLSTPCTPCAIGSYASSGGETVCTQCPAGTTTETAGAWLMRNCSVCTADVCNGNGDCSVRVDDSGLVTPVCTCRFFFSRSDRCKDLDWWWWGAPVIIGVLFLIFLSWRFVRKNYANPLLSTRRELVEKNREVEDLTRAWEINYSDLQLIERIDITTPGAFGEVWKAMYSDRVVAMKRLQTILRSIQHNAMQMFQREIQVMRSIRHGNVVMFFGAGYDNVGNPFLVTEFMERGSLRDVLQDKRVRLDAAQRLRFVLDAAKGMNFLHNLKPPRIHRDLKTGNLLVSDRWVVKVADFGTATLYDIESSIQAQHEQQTYRTHSINSSGSDERQPLLTQEVGTPLYMAPEVIQRKKYGPGIDVYSFGIILWEVYTRKEPFFEVSGPSNVLFRAVQSGVRPTIPNRCPTVYKCLMEACWSNRVKDRPPFSSIVEIIGGMENNLSEMLMTWQTDEESDLLSLQDL
eukprot:m.183210 g.183210  ORF g.183210 m.183210 type:complete len:1272 (-) comp17471_c0_seq2:580-4395(-)